MNDVKVEISSASLGSALAPSGSIGSSSSPYSVCVGKSASSADAASAGVSMSRNAKVLGAVTFTIVGVCQLFVWNICLNALFDICVTLYGWGDMMDTLIGVYQLFNVSTQLVLMYFGGLRKYLFLSGGFILGFLVLMLALLVQFLDNNAGIVLMHFLIAAIGSSVGLLLGSGFAFAAMMPVNYCGYVAFGMGFSGLLSFGFWMLFTKCIWTDLQDHSDLRKSLWVMCAVAAAVCWSGMFLFISTFRKSWAKKSLHAVLTAGETGPVSKKSAGNGKKVAALSVVKEATGRRVHAVASGESTKCVSGESPNEDEDALTSSSREVVITSARVLSVEDEQQQCATYSVEGRVLSDLPADLRRTSSCLDVVLSSSTYSEMNINSSEPSAVDVEENMLPPRAWKCMLKDSGVQLFNIGFTMWITLCVFPVIGPLSWGGDHRDIIMGIFQIGDFVGRYIPNAGFVPIIGKAIMIPPNRLIVAVVARVVFIVLFMILFKLQNIQLFNHLAIQIIIMATFAITNGWFCTLGLIYAPSTVKRDAEKAKVGIAASIAIMVGIVVGLWMAKLYKL